MNQPVQCDIAVNKNMAFLGLPRKNGDRLSLAMNAACGQYKIMVAATLHKLNRSSSSATPLRAQEATE